MGAFELRPPSPVHRKRRLEFPFFINANGAVKAILGGWRANAIFLAQAGAPFTVNLSVDRANVGTGPAQRPDQVRKPIFLAASERLKMV